MTRDIAVGEVGMCADALGSRFMIYVRGSHCNYSFSAPVNLVM